MDSTNAGDASPVRRKDVDASLERSQNGRLLGAVNQNQWFAEAEGDLPTVGSAVGQAGGHDWDGEAAGRCKRGETNDPRLKRQELVVTLLRRVAGIDVRVALRKDEQHF